MGFCVRWKWAFCALLPHKQQQWRWLSFLSSLQAQDVQTSLLLRIHFIALVSIRVAVLLAMEEVQDGGGVLPAGTRV